MNEEGVSETSYSTYFKTLSDDVCFRLLEWLDTVRFEIRENEQHPDTEHFIQGGRKFLSFLFSEDGPFRNVVPSVLTKILLFAERGSTDVFIENGLIHIGPELFEGEELERGLVERVLKACGESVKEIVLAIDDIKLLRREGGENFFIRKFESLVGHYCPSIERLEFDSAFLNEETTSTLFAAYSSQLRSISWCNLGAGDSFWLPDFSSCTQIRELSLPATPHLTSLLECTGPLLESLNVTFDSFEGYREVIDAIEDKCKKLMHIRLPDSRNIINSLGEARYAAFLCSYGTQLITAQICGMVEPEHLLDVFRKCSNLNVESQRVEDYGMMEWERVCIFGPRIQKLVIGVVALTNEESCRAVSSCTSLSKLSIFSYDDVGLEQDIIDTTMISILSSLRTPSLKQLSLIGFAATEENVAMVVAATSNLISIRLELAEPIHDGTIFKSIEDSNPSLREVEIQEHQNSDVERDEESAVELLRVLVDTFSKCRSLMFCISNRADEVVCEETIRDICGALPCRGIDLFVRIGSTCYGRTHRLGCGLMFPL